VSEIAAERTLKDYVNEAKKAQRFRSDAALGTVLGVGMEAVRKWKQGSAVPNEGIIVQLAEMGGNDPLLALIDCRAQFSKDARAKAYWQKHRWQVKKNIAVGLGVLFLAITGNLTLTALPYSSSNYQKLLNCNGNPNCAIFTFVRGLIVRVRRRFWPAALGHVMRENKGLIRAT
jgi:hypothetical protein